MPNANKRKGDRAEIAVANALRDLGFPDVARTRAGHPDDHGDMWLCPGVIAQVKDVAQAAYGPWLAATEQQRTAADADRAILVHKRRGIADASQWLVVMTVEQAAELLRAAGHGDPLDPAADDEAGAA